jgi:hypothetical protein
VKVNEDIQVPLSITGQVRAFLFDTLRLFARALNRRPILNSVDRITVGADSTDDLIVDASAKGVVLKSPNGHYWRVSVSNAGALSTADLGTAKP